MTRKVVVEKYDVNQDRDQNEGEGEEAEGCGENGEVDNGHEGNESVRQNQGSSLIMNSNQAELEDKYKNNSYKFYLDKFKVKQKSNMLK